MFTIRHQEQITGDTIIGGKVSIVNMATIRRTSAFTMFRKADARDL